MSNPSESSMSKPSSSNQCEEADTANLTIACDALYLCACAIKGTLADPQRLERIDSEALWDFADRQSILGCVAMALPLEHMEQSERWQKALAIYSRRALLLDAERNRIFAWLDEQGIRHSQLKGSLMKDYYPALGMRYMADNDFWFDSQHANELRAFMEASGYMCESFNHGVHDVYLKQPLLNFEPHYSLFSESKYPKWHRYFRDALSQAPVMESTECEARMSMEDFYLHHICHAAKHLWGSGTGVRALVDEMVMLKRFSSTLDWQLIQQRCKQLDVAVLEAQFRRVAQLFLDGKVLVSHDLQEQDNRLLQAMALANTYGTIQQQILNKLDNIMKQTDGSATDRKIRVFYVWKRLFPPLSDMAEWIPVLRTWPVLYPAVWVFRMARFLIAPPRWKKMLSELSTIRKH